MKKNHKYFVLPIVLLTLLMLSACVFFEKNHQLVDISHVSAENYDDNLCALAQKIIINAESEQPFQLEILKGQSNGFHTIQMDVDSTKNTITIATSKNIIQLNNNNMMTHVACKMVNRDRVNHVLNTELSGPSRSCKDINQLTYQLALSQLSAEEKNTYLSEGKKLNFTEDYITQSGAEWLPVNVDKFIINKSKNSEHYLEIQAPSVQVPWNKKEQKFFQGTHHCKLISLAAMKNWMRYESFNQNKYLLPPLKTTCNLPEETTNNGSCLFYFSPAKTTFCKDYSGENWNEKSIKEECKKRHASKAALKTAKNKYYGAGGIFSKKSCKQRQDVKTIKNTCIFNCKAGDEAQWHALAGDNSDLTNNNMMAKACDLFIDYSKSVTK